MGIVFDLIFVGIIVAVVILSKNKGFVASCLDTLSLVISTVASFILTKPVAEAIYNFAVKDLVKNSFKSALDQANGGISIPEKVDEMVNALPEPALKLADYIGVNVEALKQKASLGMYSDEELIEIVSEHVAYDIMIVIVQAICFMALFILVSLVVKFVASFMSATLSKLPVVGSVDAILGAAFGLVKGCLIVVATGVLFTIIVATAEANSPLLAIEESYIYNFLWSFSPIAIGA